MRIDGQEQRAGYPFLFAVLADGLRNGEDVLFVK